MSLDVAIRHRVEDFSLDAAFSCDGRLTALFGHSGAGKTTLVNAIGGLVSPDDGRIVVNGRVLFDRQARVAIPAHRRRIGYVFQEGRLFPHLDVRQNLLFGRYFTPRNRREAEFDTVVSLLGIGPLLQRRTPTLSGGEKQRVAIGRALLSDPDLLLMDEPLASLDDARKNEIYPYIERIRDEGRVPIVYVTHSVAEIAQLASFIVILTNGRVSASGPATEIMGRVELFPQFGALEAGAVIDARVAGQDAAFHLTNLHVKAGSLSVPMLRGAAGTPLRLRLRARDILVSLEAPKGLSARNVLPGCVVALAEQPGGVDVTINCHGDLVVARLTRKSVHELALKPGLNVYAIIKAMALEGGSGGAETDGGPSFG